MENKINICFGINNEYSQHAGCVMASILANSNRKDNYHFYIISNLISDENKLNFDKLKRIRDFEITFCNIDEKELANINLNHLGTSALYRLKCFDVIPEDKVLYLDADIIVRHNIEPLYSIELGNYLSAGVEDLVAPKIKEKLGLDSNAFCINSGVLLFNLKECRKTNYKKILFDYLSNQEIGDDQESLNYTMQSKIKPVDITWNYTYYVNMYDDQEHHKNVGLDPSILHFLGPKKPWIPIFNPIGRSEYFKYLKLTPWYSRSMIQYAEQIIFNENSIY